MALLQRLFRAREDQLQLVAHPADDGQLVGEEVIIHQLDDSEARESVRGEANLYDFHEGVYTVLETGGQGRQLHVPLTGLSCFKSKKRGRPVRTSEDKKQAEDKKRARAQGTEADMEGGASKARRKPGRPVGSKDTRPRGSGRGRRSERSERRPPSGRDMEGGASEASGAHPADVEGGVSEASGAHPADVEGGASEASAARPAEIGCCAACGSVSCRRTLCTLKTNAVPGPSPWRPNCGNRLFSFSEQPSNL